MKRTFVKILSLTTALMLLMTCAAFASDAQQWKITIYDSDAETILAETTAEDGKAATLPELAKDSYTLSGLFVTPALLRPFDPETPITQDISLFAAWESAKVDDRPWMIAGSLAGYPENNWGKVWPQDDFLLTAVEDEANTFTITLNLYAGDEFKVAVVEEGAVWLDSVGGSALAEQGALTGGEDAFNTGSNIKVNETGKYLLTFVSDAETLSLCKLSYEIVGEADAPQYEFNFQIQGDFNEWGADAEADIMNQNGTDNAWYYLLDVPAGETWMFGIKNLVNGDWYDLRKVDASATPNFSVGEGRWLVWLSVAIENNVATVSQFVVEQPHYYVVGTVGAQGWAADCVLGNEKYQMKAQEDGTYALTVEFTAEDTADWTDGKTAFKVAYGTHGLVPNECWYSDEDGANLTADAGTYTIVFDPATGIVTY